jgi:hypothetical protein
MRKSLAFMFLAALAVPASSAPSTTGGNSGLALAALVGLQSPALSHHRKFALRRYLAGHSMVAFPPHAKIHVTAKGVVCRASNVDITHHGCTLTFASATVELSGRAAHELYATLVENGVPGEGAAGTIFEALSKLDCTLDPHEIAQNAGGGASCTYTPGPP